MPDFRELRLSRVQSGELAANDTDEEDSLELEKDVLMVGSLTRAS